MKSMLLALAAAVSLMTVGAAGAADAGADLAKAQGCVGCHAPAEKKVGPSLQEIAAKYKGNKDAAATLTAKLKEGKGHMKVAAAEAELKTLVQWALAGK